MARAGSGAGRVAAGRGAGARRCGGPQRGAAPMFERSLAPPSRRLGKRQQLPGPRRPVTRRAWRTRVPNGPRGRGEAALKHGGAGACRDEVEDERRRGDKAKGRPPAPPRPDRARERLPARLRARRTGRSARGAPAGFMRAGG